MNDKEWFANDCSKQYNDIWRHNEFLNDVKLIKVETNYVC